MHDLNTITKLNADAVASGIETSRNQGKYVVVEFAGVHVIGYETFSGEGAKDQAEAKLHKLNTKGDSTHGRLFHPRHADVAAKLVENSAA